MILNPSKRTLNFVYQFKIYFSSKAKAPNHYETLKVTQSSTQADIKSAYYELSKKYHPDINKSEDAKKNFQDLSDAYEVLGNFSKRKLYDRDLIATGTGIRKAQTHAYTNVEVDPLAGFYKSRNVQREYDPHRETATDQVKYDFDQWTRAHYGFTLRRSLNDKNSRIFRQKLQQKYHKEKEHNKSTALYIISATTLTMIFLSIQAYYTRTNYDR